MDRKYYIQRNDKGDFRLCSSSPDDKQVSHSKWMKMEWRNRLAVSIDIDTTRLHWLVLFKGYALGVWQCVGETRHQVKEITQ